VFSADSDILASMQAAEEELEVQRNVSSVPWWEAAPFQGVATRESSSFASVLSAMAAPEPEREGHWRVWSEADKAKDEASLSYESALRAQVRWKPDDRLDPETELNAGEATSDGPEIADEPASQTDPRRRCASVTVRLSEAENVRLRKRAAEAGLTISAYLRSCTLEVETLRAQVKQALAELRAASPEEKPFPHGPERHTPRRWWLRRPHIQSWSAQA
jgi:predicted DNA binding CopG/RHH family protein